MMGQEPAWPDDPKPPRELPPTLDFPELNPDFPPPTPLTPCVAPLP
jgi:hypothetical protein